jgi:hypothetical protein
LTGTETVLPTISGPRDYLAFSVTSDRPDERQAYAYAVMVGWGALLAVGTVCRARVRLRRRFGRRRVGETRGRRDLCRGNHFLRSGHVNAMGRASWFPWGAKRHARRGDVADERFARAMRGILPRNSSLIGQSILAVLTLMAILA